MALAALHLLGHVKSTWAAAFRGLYALAVDDAGRRRRLAPDGLTRAPDETAIDAMPSPVVPPTVEVALHGRARRKFSPERPPLTAGSKNVKNGIHYGSQIRRSWASYSSRRRHQRLQQRPFRVCRVACTASAASCGARWNRAWLATGPAARGLRQPGQNPSSDAAERRRASSG